MSARIDKALGSLARFGVFWLGFVVGSCIGLAIGIGVDRSSYLPFYTGVVGGLVGAALAQKVAIRKAGGAEHWVIAVFALLGCVGVGAVVKNAAWVLPIVPRGPLNPANPLALEIGFIVGLAAAAWVMVRRPPKNE